MQKIADAVAKHAATATELGEVAFTRGYGAFFELKGGPYGGVFFKDWPHQPVCRNPDDLPLVTDALSIIRENGARLHGLDKAERPMRHAIAPVALAVIAISIFVIIVAALK